MVHRAIIEHILHGHSKILDVDALVQREIVEHVFALTFEHTGCRYFGTQGNSGKLVYIFIRVHWI